jgi:hypothetical protein
MMSKPSSFNLTVRLAIAALWLFGCNGVAQAQEISNARDAHGNLVERGAATRSYPSVPNANSAIPPALVKPKVVILRPKK